MEIDGLTSWCWVAVVVGRIFFEDAVVWGLDYILELGLLDQTQGGYCLVFTDEAGAP